MKTAKYADIYLTSCHLLWFGRLTQGVGRLGE